MDRKIIFLDVDGTLCDHDNRVPYSAAAAIKQARRNGHLVYLCTGRSRAELFDSIMRVGFDGVIGAGGGYVAVGEQMLYHKRVKDEDVKHLVDFFTGHEIDFYVESNGGLYGSPNLVKRLESLIYGDVEHDPAAQAKKKQGHSFIDALIVGESMYRSDINKACFMDSHLPFETIRKEFEGEFTVLHCTVPMFGENSGELAVPGVDKASAIEALLEHLEISRDDTIALGDGLNDIEMLEYCNIGIAMEDGADKLREIADDITPSYDNDGIHQAFRKYRLI